MVQALEDIKKAGCNALCVYLGNFGPEISQQLRKHMIISARDVEMLTAVC